VYYLLGGALAVLALLAAACSSQPSLKGTEDVPIQSIPWADGEEARYLLSDRDGERVGEATLRIEEDGDRYRLIQTYTSPTARDELVSVVDGHSLKPVTFERKASQGGEVRGVSAHFTDSQVLATFTRGDSSQDKDADFPEHGYDNESLIFLWRAMPLEDDFNARIVGIAFDLGARSIVNPVASIRVVQQEQVEVPAGTFDVWRVEAVSGGGTVTAWITADAPHYLVKYDSGRNVIYEMEELPASE
jgi:hypothetical protein